MKDLSKIVEKIDALPKETSSKEEAYKLLQSITDSAKFESLAKVEEFKDRPDHITKVLHETDYKEVDEFMTYLIKSMDVITKVQKESYKESWDYFSVISDSEWLRYKRYKKNDTLMANFYDDKSRLRNMLQSDCSEQDRDSNSV